MPFDIMVVPSIPTRQAWLRALSPGDVASVKKAMQREDLRRERDNLEIQIALAMKRHGMSEREARKLDSIAAAERALADRVRLLVNSDVNSLMETLSRVEVMWNYVDNRLRTYGWTEAETEHFIRRNLESWEQFGIGCWGIWVTHNTKPKLVGYCGLTINTWSPNPKHHGKFEFSFRIHPNFWGRGLGVEVGCAALDWAFHSFPELKSVLAFSIPENLQSLHCLTSIGFNYTNQTLNYMGATTDNKGKFAVYRIRRQEWLTLQRERSHRMVTAPRR